MKIVAICEQLSIYNWTMDEGDIKYGLPLDNCGQMAWASL